MDPARRCVRSIDWAPGIPTSAWSHRCLRDRRWTLCHPRRARHDELERIANEDIAKLSVRDLPVVLATKSSGATTVAAGAVVGPDTTLVDTVVAAGATVLRTHSIGAEIGPEATVGPYSYLRPGTKLGAKSKVGGFVETKNAQVGGL